MRLLFAMIIGIALLSSCNTGTEKYTTSENHVKVTEVLQTTSYTYLNVTENDQDFWMAVTKMDAKVGDEFYYSGDLEMLDFESKELNRVFDKILFVDKISKTPITAAVQAEMPMNHQSGKTTEQIKDIKVEVAEGGISIAELFENRDKYADKKVLVRGQVVKVNHNIMNRSWVHLQDGTANEGNFDLTVTTQDVVEVGDIVTFEGKVSLNKDFGSGYSYEVIVEEAGRIDSL